MAVVFKTRRVKQVQDAAAGQDEAAGKREAAELQRSGRTAATRLSHARADSASTHESARWGHFTGGLQPKPAPYYTLITQVHEVISSRLYHLHS